MSIRSITVFCGSKSGTDPLYEQHARELGAILAAQKITLVYGGGSKGLMGAVADGVMENNGYVVGIIPEVLIEWEHQHEGISELHVVADMHVRKKKMYELGDAGLVMPGGVGTLDELFEMLTWNQLSIHNKKIFLLNTNNYYEHLVRHMEQMTAKGFLWEALEERIITIHSPQELINFL